MAVTIYIGRNIQTSSYPSERCLLDRLEYRSTITGYMSLNSRSGIQPYNVHSYHKFTTNNEVLGKFASTVHTLGELDTNTEVDLEYRVL